MWYQAIQTTGYKVWSQDDSDTNSCGIEIQIYVSQQGKPRHNLCVQRPCTLTTILDCTAIKGKHAHQQMISTIFTNAMSEFTNMESLEAKQECKCPKPVTGTLFPPMCSLFWSSGGSRVPSRISTISFSTLQPSQTQCEMSAISFSKEIRKERWKPGTFRQCLPHKWWLMTTDSISSLCLKSEIVKISVLTSAEIAGTKPAFQHQPRQLYCLHSSSAMQSNPRRTVS